jgi:hypothetical protein
MAQGGRERGEASGRGASASLNEAVKEFLLFDVCQNERAVRRHKAVEPRHCFFEQRVLRNKAQ